MANGGDLEGPRLCQPGRCRTSPSSGRPQAGCASDDLGEQRWHFAPPVGLRRLSSWDGENRQEYRKLRTLRSHGPDVTLGVRVGSSKAPVKPKLGLRLLVASVSVLGAGVGILRACWRGDLPLCMVTLVLAVVLCGKPARREGLGWLMVCSCGSLSFPPFA